jgi:hypothetical protein
LDHKYAGKGKLGKNERIILKIVHKETPKIHTDKEQYIGVPGSCEHNTGQSDCVDG